MLPLSSYWNCCPAISQRGRRSSPPRLDPLQAKCVRLDRPLASQLASSQSGSAYVCLRLRNDAFRLPLLQRHVLAFRWHSSDPYRWKKIARLIELVLGLIMTKTTGVSLLKLLFAMFCLFPVALVTIRVVLVLITVFS